MTAIASSAHSALLDEYRAALQLWSEVRALYGSDTSEVEEATRRVEELELKLSDYRD